MPDPSPPPATPDSSPLDRARGAAARLLDRLPSPVRVALSGRRPVRIDGQTLDPTVQLAVALRTRADRPRDTQENPAWSRARFRREVLSTVGAPTPVWGCRDLTVEGAAGPLGARLYTPDPAEHDRPPVVVYFHGGGYVEGDLDTADEGCRVLCAESGHAVLSVDYRLAPEHPFPAGPRDALAAFRWAQAHAARLGVGAVTVGGDSAGAALAATVAQAARDDAPPAAQLLIYPPTDVPTDRPSRTLFDGFFLPDAQRRAYLDTYTAGTGADDRDPRLSPHYGRLDGLAPALVVTAGFDVLRDEVDAYAAALAEAGTPVEPLRFPSLPHGFVNVTAISRASRAALAETARRWRRWVASAQDTGGARR